MQQNIARISALALKMGQTKKVKAHYHPDLGHIKNYLYFFDLTHYRGKGRNPGNISLLFRKVSDTTNLFWNYPTFRAEICHVGKKLYPEIIRPLVNPKRLPQFWIFELFLVVTIRFILKIFFVTYFLTKRWYNWGTPAGDAEALTFLKL